jgi:hypothetical protein
VERVFIPSPGYTIATVDVRKGGHQILRSGDTLTNDREFPFLYADKKRLFSIFRYENVLVSGRQYTIQIALERESSIEISQSRQYAH